VIAGRALAALCLCAVLPAGAAWPRMARYDATFPVDATAQWTELRIPLRDVKGKLVHEIVCKGSGDEAFQDKHNDRTNENVVGILQCEPTFYLEDGSPIWHTRMQFWAHDLVGDCGRYPEFGTVRNFRVQGMRITLEARDIQLDDEGQPQAFNLRVSVRNDPGATKEYTLRPGYLHPKQDCSHVKRGGEPLMCRIPPTYSWGLCRGV
jgi:hypothetical protein